MRITQRAMTRNFLNGLNRSQLLLNKSNQKINSGMKHQHMSENVSAGSKLLRVRDDINSDEQYIATIQDADNELSSAEDNLRSIVDILVSAQTDAMKVMNTATIDASSREIIAGSVRGLKDQVLKTINSQFSDKFLFGGTNNEKPPFEFDANGEVLYNGFPVNDIFKAADGNHYVEAENPGDPPILVAENKKRYVDIGLGLSANPDGTINGNTAFDIGFSGLDVLGFGEDEKGNPKNVLALIDKLASSIHSPPPAIFDANKLGEVNDLLRTQKESTLLSITEIGTRTNFLENTANRLESDIINLKGLRAQLIETDPAEEITNLKMYEFAWNSVLKMGSRLIPPSLMDFIN